MATWTVSGVRVETDGSTISIVGSDRLAERLRVRGSVGIVPEPGGSVPVRADSDWLVDRWVRQTALFLGAGEVVSDYTPHDEDIPVEARELFEAREGDEYVEDRIY